MFNNFWSKAGLFLLLVSTASADHDAGANFAGYNNKVYFSTYNTTTQVTAIIEVDGSTTTTIKTFDSGIYLNTMWTGTKYLSGVVAGGKLYFKTSKYTSGVGTTYTIWSYDGTTFESLFSVENKQSTGYLYPGDMFAYDGKLHFSLGSTSSSNPNPGYSFYSLSGSDTTKVATVSSGISLYGPYYFVAFGNDLYFSQSSYSAGVSTYYLRKYNGSTVETVKLSSTSISNLKIFDSKIYWYSSTYANVSGVGTYTFSLYYYDPSDGSSGGGGSAEQIVISDGYLHGPVVFGSKLVFYKRYNNSSSNSEIVAYDGTSFSTLVSSSNSGGYMGYNSLFEEYQNRLLWSASSSGSSGNYKLYAYDGSSVYEPQNTSTPPVKLGVATVSSYGSNKIVAGATEHNSILYFSVKDNSASTNNLEIWSYTIAAPAFESGYPVASNVSDDNFEIKAKTDKAGTLYYVVLTDGATTPENTDVKAGYDVSGNTDSVAVSGSTTLTAETEKSVSIITGISSGTKYDVYLVVEDNSTSPLLQSSATLVEIETSSTALPVFISGSPSATVDSEGTSITLSIEADVTGTAYYVLLADGATTPENTDVKNGTGKAGGSTYASSSVTITANTAATATISSLTESTKYDAYIVVEDNASTPNIQSSAIKVDIDTDKTPPIITAPSATGITTTTFDFGFQINETGTGYYVVLADGATAPDSAEVKALTGSGGATAIKSGSVVLQTNVENTVSITGLSSETTYTVYYAAEDGNSNLIRGSNGFDVTTVAVPKKYTISGSGETLSGSSSDYTTIQQGITAAKASTDTLVVSSGTYTENIDFGGKDIIIKSESGASLTILEPLNTGIPIVSFIGNETSSAKLIGFTLKSGGNLRGSAIQFNNSSPIIENCIITASAGEGAVSFYYSSATLKNCVIYGNSSTNPLYFDASSSSPLINNCTIANNAGYGGGYISPSLTIAPTFQNSILWNNTSGGVSGRYTISNSIVQGGFPTGTSILSSDPVFVDLVNGNFTLSDYSPAIGTANSSTATTEDIVSTVRGSPPDMGAYEHSSSAPLTDTDAPTVSHVREGTTGDLAYIGTATQISAHWNGSDAASGIKKYEYAVDTSATTITGTIKEWTSAGTDTSATIDTLSLIEGKTYYVSVRATDKLNNVSDVVTSNGVKIDITAPTVGSVVHGTDHHLHWLSDTSGAKATWSGFSDGTSGIKEYEVLLRDTLNKTNIVDWTNVGLEVTYSFTALALLNNGQYYLKVRASDAVGNLSHLVESSVFQVDNEKPVVTTLFETMEGKTDDIDWFAPEDKIIHRFAGTDNGAILQYKFAIGTTDSTDDIIAWAVTVNDSSDTTVTDTLEEGKLYYSNLKLKDKADNLGDIFSSDGFQIDGSPPKSGQVSDGASEDIDFSESTISTIVNWSGFADNGSGISHYLVSLGTSSGGKEVHEPVNVGNVSNYLFTGLYLEHGVTYYSSVAAVDSVGNGSINVSSDGFTMDVYPGPPRVASRKPDETTFLSLINGGHLVFNFSEPVKSADLSIYSKLGDELQFERIDDRDSIAIALSGPLTSLDTIQVEMSQLTDESGRVGNDTLLTFYNEMIADYNHDTAIDASDLSMLVTGWTSKDYFYELGPVEGEAPYFVPIVDMEYDLRDLMAFTRMWHWYHGTPQLLNLARVNFGEELDVTVNDKSLTLTIPEHVIAGQLAFQVSDSELSVTLPEEKTGDVILLSHTEAGLLQSVMDFAYFNEDGERNFVLPLEYGTHSSTLTLSYALYGKDGVVTGQGVVTMDVTPVPAEFVLSQNYPNPFNPTTQIKYGLPVDGQVKLTIYDLLGQEVRSLVSGLDQSAGYHNVMWDARDNRGLAVSAGVYVYRLASRGEDGQKFSRTKKMVLLK